MKIEKKIAIIALLFSVLLYTVFSATVGSLFAKSFAAGFVLGIANFIGLTRSIRNAFTGGVGKAIIYGTQVRLLVLGIVCYILIVPLHMNIIGILVGLSITVVCIPGYVVYNTVRGNKDGTATPD